MDHYRKQYRELTYHQSGLTEDPDSRNLLEQLFDNNGNWNANVRKYDPMDVNEHLLDDHEFRTVFQDCLNDLPEKWYAVVQMKYLIEKNSEDICQELGITPSNYWQLLHRSKLLLRECLKKKWYDEIG
jgi:RNA polymerase sigma-70 factor (ECF subfamily)